VSESPEAPVTHVHKVKEAPTVYSNICLVRTTPEEVMLHFAQRWPDDPSQGDTVVTVYTNLWHAKRLALTLLQSIEKYEAIFGEIPKDPIALLSPEMIAKLEVPDDNH
jgi:hypothetical protein